MLMMHCDKDSLHGSFAIPPYTEYGFDRLCEKIDDMTFLKEAFHNIEKVDSLTFDWWRYLITSCFTPMPSGGNSTRMRDLQIMLLTHKILSVVVTFVGADYLFVLSNDGESISYAAWADAEDPDVYHVVTHDELVTALIYSIKCHEDEPPFTYIVSPCKQKFLGIGETNTVIVREAGKWKEIRKEEFHEFSDQK